MSEVLDTGSDDELLSATCLDPIEWLGTDIGPCFATQTTGEVHELITITQLYHYFKSLRLSLGDFQKQLARAERKINHKFKIEIVDRIKSFYSSLFGELRSLGETSSAQVGEFSSRMRQDLFRQGQGFHYTQEGNLETPAAELFTDTTIEYEMQLDAVLEQLHAAQKTIYDQETRGRMLEDKIATLNQELATTKTQRAALEAERDRIESASAVIIENQRTRLTQLKGEIEHLEREHEDEVKSMELSRGQLVRHHEVEIKRMTEDAAEAMSSAKKLWDEMRRSAEAELLEKQAADHILIEELKESVLALQAQVEDERDIHQGQLDQLHNLIATLKEENLDLHSQLPKPEEVLLVSRLLPENRTDGMPDPPTPLPEERPVIAEEDIPRTTTFSMRSTDRSIMIDTRKDPLFTKLESRASKFSELAKRRYDPKRATKVRELRSPRRPFTTTPSSSISTPRISKSQLGDKAAIAGIFTPSLSPAQLRFLSSKTIQK